MTTDNLIFGVGDDNDIYTTILSRGIVASQNLSNQLDSIISNVDIMDKYNPVQNFSKPEYSKKRIFTPKEVIFNKPATIIIWEDGSKTVVKCGKNDAYDKEKGVAMCFMKKLFDNKGNYNDVFRKFVTYEDC